MQVLKNTYQRFIQNTFLPNRFFIAWSTIIVFFIISFSIEFLFPFAKILLALLVVATITDFLIVKIFERKIVCIRTVPQVLPLGDEVSVSVFIKNNQTSIAKIEVIDELPEEFQKRDFSFKFNLASNEEKR